MRILVADSLESSAVAALEAAGHTCDLDPDLSGDTLPDHIGDHEALIVRSTKVTAATVDAGKDLKLVVRAGAGTNTIDVAAATDAGVVVTNVPGRNAAAVAELAFGLMLAIDRRIPDGVVKMRDGQWDKKGMSKGARGLAGASLGIVGLGNIGLGVAHRAKAFGMKVIALHRPGRSPESQARITDLRIELLDSLPALAAAVDILSLHIPAGPSTAGIVDQETIDAMRPGAMLINTSRADIIDSDALLAALDCRSHPRRARCLPGRAGQRERRVDLAAVDAPRRRRNAPHRRLHRAGPARRRRRSGRRRRRLRGRRTDPRREPCGTREGVGRVTLVRRFPARIVKAERATDVVCPMHDALSAAQRANLLLENPLSYLNVTRSTLDMPGASYEEIGAVNAAGLERLLRSGSYGDLLDPGIYVYRIDRDGDVHTGVVADLDVSGFVDGRVLGHEDVKPEKVEALAKHFEAVPTRSELVAVMHQDDDQAAAVVAATTARPPILTVTDLTGVEQQVWRVDQTGTDLLIERLSALRHYVADGHHRVAATVARWHDHGSPRGGTVLCVLYPESQTHLMAFDRLVAGPIDADDLLVGLRRVAEVTEVDGPIRSHGGFGLHLAGSWYRVQLPPPTDARGG